MSFEVGVVAGFDARHHLIGNFGPAREPHGHAYRVEAWVSGDHVRADGTLFDITLLQAALNAAMGDLQGKDLNTIAAFASSNPTAEIVARYLAGQVAEALGEQGLSSLRVRVWESPEAFAGYSVVLT